MASFTSQLLDEFLVALRQDLGTYDLSTTNLTWRCVMESRIQPAIDPPYLVLAPPGRITDTYGEAPLGEYDQSGEIDFIGFVSTDQLEFGLRIKHALDMAEEVERAIYSTRLVANQATYPLCYGSLLRLWVTIDSVEAGGGDMPTVHPTFTGTIYWRRVTVGGV